MLERVNFAVNSDQFIFDQEIVAQMVQLEQRFVEVSVPTRYFPEASSASFGQSCLYGLSVLRVLLQFVLHRTGICPQRRFDCLTMRDQPEPDNSPSNQQGDPRSG